MVIGLQLNWPEVLLKFFEGIAIINDTNKSILKIYCFFKDCKFIILICS